MYCYNFIIYDQSIFISIESIGYIVQKCMAIRQYIELYQHPAASFNVFFHVNFLQCKQINRKIINDVFRLK